jgi:hypothetical protein
VIDMKYACGECGAVLYGVEVLKRCDCCGGVLARASAERSWVECGRLERKVELRFDIPDCGSFVLNNAHGSRCTYLELHGRCIVSSLPELHPRVGIVADEEVKPGG